MKYSLVLLTASVCLFTVLCVSAETHSEPDAKPEKEKDFLDENLVPFFEALSDPSKSSNTLVTYVRDTVQKYIDSFDNDKKHIQDAVTEGTEVEKKIQTISHMLKSSIIPLTTELQSELEEIEKRAANELKKIKEMENVEDINKMHKYHKEKYEDIKGQVGELSKAALAAVSEYKAKKTINMDELASDLKTKLFNIIKATVPVMFTVKKDTDTVYNKLNIVSNAISIIRDDLIKVEQIQHLVLLSPKENFKKDAASSIRLSLAQCVFAIVLGILF